MQSVNWIDLASRMNSRIYNDFLRSIGVTEQNANEYEIMMHQGDDLNAEIWHNGIKVGEIVTRWEIEGGYRFVVECKSA